jgi:hypothetical protein
MSKKAQTEDDAAVKGELVSVDRKMVDEAVDYIQRIALEGIKKTLGDVGEYIISKFFRDDIELAKSKNPFKNASYQALVERCGTAHFPVSKTWLNNAVGIALLNRQLPSSDSSFKLLAPSIQQTLLPLRDPERVEKVARKVMDGEYTLRKTRELVAQERAKMSKDETRGRTPTPVITKVLNRSLKLFTFEAGKRSFTKDDVKALEDDQRKVAVKSAKALIEKLEGLVSKLEKS